MPYSAFPRLQAASAKWSIIHLQKISIHNACLWQFPMNKYEMQNNHYMTYFSIFIEPQFFMRSFRMLLLCH